MPARTAKPSARSKLLDAALSMIRAKGYSATTVDEPCAAAGVTKDAFFHHFKSKDELGCAAAEHWSEVTGALFAAAPCHDLADPLDRVLGHVAFRKVLLQGGVPDFTCLVGTILQETYETAPAIREACDRSISTHARTGGRYRGGDARPGHVARLDTRIARPPHPGCPAGRFHPRHGQGGSRVAADRMHHPTRYLTPLFRASGETPDP